VSASANNDRVNINVADSGIGMSDEKVGSLFKLNAKSTYGTKGEKGIGLGLQLVSEFTRLNQGTISLVSKEGMGTTFTINLPAKPAQT
jgi:signal transduction histidine kinase